MNNSPFNVSRPKEYLPVPKPAKKKNIKNMVIPQGPKPKIIIGNIDGLVGNTIKFLVDMNKQYGDVSSFFIGNQLCLAVFDAEMIQEIHTTKQKSFIKGIGFRKMRKVLGEGLLTSEEPIHLNHRRSVQPSFHKDKINEYSKIMFEETNKMIVEWKKEEVVNVYPEMFQLTLSIVGKSLFGTNPQKYAKDISKNLEISSDRIAKLTVFNFGDFVENLPIPWLKGYKRSTKNLSNIAQKIIEERKNNKNNDEDLLGLLLGLKEYGFSDKEIRDEILTIILAGHETTATLLTWSIMWLGKNNNSLEKLQKESDNTPWIKEKRFPTLEESYSLTFVGQVIDETLRLSSPSWFNMRQASEDVYLKNIFVPKGTHIVISPYITHRMKKYYKNPMRWYPERWTDEFKKDLPKGAYIPFGLGTRKCIGDQFGILEAKIILLLLAHNFSWKIDSPGNSMPKIKPRVTLRPKGLAPIFLYDRDHFVL